MKYKAFFAFLIFIGNYTFAYSSQSVARADLYNSEGRVIGVATLLEELEGVSIAIQIFDIPAGLHGFHIHSVGRCELPDFKSAGGHFNPYDKKHGLKNPQGPHAGDFLNILVGSSRRATFIRFAPLVTLGDGKNSLFDKDGSAIIIHAGSDDQISNPSGNAGARIACGIISNYE